MVRAGPVIAADDLELAAQLSRWHKFQRALDDHARVVDYRP
jgi:hypothetical protein